MNKKCKKLEVPFKSWRQNKKLAVCVKDSKGEIQIIHFGDSRYKHNYSKQARENYLKRSSGIKNSAGKLTKDDKLSPNYWSRRILWKA
jgi:hypothetical protein